jgi:hypothetical protein
LGQWFGRLAKLFSGLGVQCIFVNGVYVKDSRDGPWNCLIEDGLDRMGKNDPKFGRIATVLESQTSRDREILGPLAATEVCMSTLCIESI